MVVYQQNGCQRTENALMKLLKGSAEENLGTGWFRRMPEKSITFKRTNFPWHTSNPLTSNLDKVTDSNDSNSQNDVGIVLDPT